VEYQVDGTRDMQELGQVAAKASEGRIAHQVGDVRRFTREEVVEAHHLIALGKEPFAQVTAQEPRATGYDDPTCVHVSKYPAGRLANGQRGGWTASANNRSQSSRNLLSANRRRAYARAACP
jgi:hypothetical protein